MELGMTDSAAEQPEETPATTDATVEPTAVDDVVMPESAAAEAAADETGTIAGSVTGPEDATEAAAKAEAEAAALKDLPRPRWRFSGKRGRPVHERDAVNKLPAEVRDVVEQFVRTVQEDQPARTAASTPPKPAPETPSVFSTASADAAPSASDGTTPAVDTEAATSDAVAEASTGAQDVTPAVAAAALPDPSAGVDELHLAVALIGHQPVLAFDATEAPAQDEAPEAPELVAEAEFEAEPVEAEPAELPAVAEIVADLVEQVATEVEPQPVAAIAEPDAPAEALDQPAAETEPSVSDALPAAEKEQPVADAAPSSTARTPSSGPARPRGRSRGTTKRRRSSLAWEKPSARGAAGDRNAPGPVEAELSQHASTRPPEAIARLTRPLRVSRQTTKAAREAARSSREASGNLVEPRVARRRSIARRAELDSALAELQSFVESTGNRR
jgi:hypothetical protein